MTKIGFIYVNSSPQLSMGVAYICGLLKKHGHKVLLWDTYYTADKNIVDEVVKSNIEILLISINTLSYNHAVKLLKAIKSKKNVPVLAGGWHTIVNPNEMILEPSIDLVCIGEGEYATQDVVNDLKFGLKNVSKMPNIWSKKNGKVIRNNPRPLGNLDDLPMPDRTIFNPSSLMDSEGKFFFSTGRGCPYNCSYCCNLKMVKLYSKLNTPYVRLRNIELCMSELKIVLKQWKPKELFFIDEMFLISESRVKEFCKAYKKEKINLPFGFMARVEKINENIVKILKDAGCSRIHFGVECGNENLRRKYLNRTMTNEQIVNAFKICKKFGIKTASFNMIGLPFETKASIKDTFSINKLCEPTYFQVSIMYPFKGTEIYDLYEKNKLLNLSPYAKQTYYDSYITKSQNLSYSYLKHQQIFMELYFNYSKLFAYISKFVPSKALSLYCRLVAFIYRKNKTRAVVNKIKRYI